MSYSRKRRENQETLLRCEQRREVGEKGKGIGVDCR
jgi:hypothetical protein